jgi:hypothetical protein
MGDPFADPVRPVRQAPQPKGRDQDASREMAEAAGEVRRGRAMRSIYLPIGVALFLSAWGGACLAEAHYWVSLLDFGAAAVWVWGAVLRADVIATKREIVLLELHKGQLAGFREWMRTLPKGGGIDGRASH